MADADLDGMNECSSRHFRQHIEVMEDFFLMDRKRRIVIIGKRTHQLSQRRHHTKIILRQNPEYVGRSHGGEARLSKGGRPGNHEPRSRVTTSPTIFSANLM